MLTGPTASGKESVALHLAPLLGAEVLSLDSMKVYRGMDVGTSKVPAADRERVPHHLVDVASPAEGMSVHRFLFLADAAMAAIRARGRAVLAAGGTVLYLRALLYGVFDGPGADPALRAGLEEEAAASGTATLHARLAAVDPAAARRIHPTDLRRLVRALEVHGLTGRPISDLQVQWAATAPRIPHRAVALRRPRATLHRRIAARVDAMLAGGLVDEVRALLDAPGGLGPTAAQAIGYREVAGLLRGEFATPGDAAARIRSRTNRLARMQETWLRSFPGMRFLDVPDDESPAETARRAVEALERSG